MVFEMSHELNENLEKAVQISSLDELFTAKQNPNSFESCIEILFKNQNKKVKKWITKKLFSEKLRYFFQRFNGADERSQQYWNSNDEINACIEFYVRLVGMIVANDKSLFRCLII